VTKRTITQIFILVTIAIWVVWDIVVYSKFGNPSTISATVWRYSWHLPSIPLAVGILIGHLFFQMKEPTAFPPEQKK
jgi:hypothetical protein